MKICFKSFLIVIAAAFAWQLAAGPQPVKYVFLFIGDGMSFQQRMMAEEFSKRTRGKGLFINSMPVSGATHTRAANSFITDSAASGTAIACGEKTNNGMLGITPDKKRLQSVAELAFKNGRKVAIISSMPINHATPAAFYAHQASRSSYHAIGLEAIASRFDYFGGGGFNKAVQDSSDLYVKAQQAGYTVARTPDEVRALRVGKGKIIAAAAKGMLPFALDKSSKDPKLEFFVRQALAHCGTEKPFFIMAEGGAIDLCGHANDAAGNLNETLEFDDAVKVAYEFYRKYPKDTLIVVTGDHETGGMSLGFAGTAYKFYTELVAAQKMSYSAMKLHFEKLFADGKLASWDNAKREITAVSGLIFTGKPKAARGTLEISAAEEKALQKAFTAEFARDKKCNKLHHQVIALVNRKAGIGWTTGAHTGTPVNTTAIGKHMELFSNMYDNTEIAKRLKLLVR